MVLKWFRLANLKLAEYSKTSQIEYQHAFCCNNLSDGLDKAKAFVVYQTEK